MTAEKNILVTGACGAIGSHLVDHFLNKGFNVFGMDILEKFSSVTKDRSRFVYASCDLGNGNATDAAIENYVQGHGAIDIVINNVGLIFNSPLIAPWVFEPFVSKTLFVSFTKNTNNIAFFRNR